MTDSAPHVDRAITSRRSTKMTVDGERPTDGGLPRATLDAILAVAGLAPFHHLAPAARRAEAVEPWRCHALDAPTCRGLRRAAQRAGETSKLLGMLGAADALALVTWLPEGEVQRVPKLRFEGTLVNQEHLATAGAFAQNVLVAATARGLRTYWSSGGWLATPAGLNAVGAGPDEVLVGALFVFPEPPADATVKPGKHHAARSPVGAWRRWVEMPDPEIPAGEMPVPSDVEAS